MKITALKEQVKNKDRVSVFVDGKYSFSLTIEQVVDERLKSGIDIEEVDIKRYLKLSLDGKHQALAMAWVLNRPRSIREFEEYCKRKKYDPELVVKMVDKYVMRGYLDQLRYAKWLIELRLRRQKSVRCLSCRV